MPQYTKKPVTIEARRLDMHDREGIAALAAWVGQGTATTHEDGLYIDTLEGTLHASDGDWIVRGIKGEFYPVKNEIFEATYQPAVDAVD